MTINHFLSTLVGPAGRYLRGKWEPDEILHRLLRSADIYVSRTAAVHILNGYKPFRHSYTKIYRGSNGGTLLERDLIAFLQGYHSTAMVRDIQLRIHMDVEASDWSADQIAALDGYYVSHDPTRDEIATYLAHVLHHIICA